jgi:uncharacterized protein
MAMRWNRLAFLHWPVDPDVIRPLVPPQLELQTRDGAAWIGITPFEMSHVRARLTPPVPSLSAFPEMNVRTYVSVDDRPGVWFFSLDAGSLLAVWGARAVFGLPYHLATMEVGHDAGAVEYRSVRSDGPHGEARFCGTYHATGPVFEAAPGSLEHWLTERYCLYSLKGGRLYRGEIHHRPWPLQTASADVRENTMTIPIGLRLLEPPPLVHFANRLDVVAWPPTRVRAPRS